MYKAERNKKVLKREFLKIHLDWLSIIFTKCF